jgi:hypothetical protein
MFRKLTCLCAAFILSLGLSVNAQARPISLKKAKRALAQAIHNKDENTVRTIFEKLAEANSPAAAKLIITVTSNNLQLDLYDCAVSSLASMNDSKAQDMIFKDGRKSKKWWIRLLLLQVVAKIDSPKAWAVLAGATVETHGTVLEELAGLFSARKNKASIDSLINIRITAEENGLGDAAFAASSALRSFTDQNLEAGIDWQNWWGRAKTKFDFAKIEAARKKKKDEQAEGSPGKQGISSVTERIKKRNESKYLERIEKGDVIVVKGVYDQVEEVLENLKIPFTLIPREKLAQLKLKASMVVIFNCHDKALDKNAAQNLRNFVSAGGYVFTSDWELRNILQHAFPKTLMAKQQIPEDNVLITPELNAATHPYLRDVFPKNPFKRAKFKWKIDAASDLVNFAKKSGVKSLIVSPELVTKYKLGIVALTFRWRGRVITGKPVHKRSRPTTGSRSRDEDALDAKEYPGGSVLHVLGHFHAQMDSSGDGFALQQLLANFIIEKQKWRAAHKKKKKKKK